MRKREWKLRATFRNLPFSLPKRENSFAREVLLESGVITFCIVADVETRECKLM